MNQKKVFLYAGIAMILSAIAYFLSGDTSDGSQHLIISGGMLAAGVGLLIVRNSTE